MLPAGAAAAGGVADQFDLAVLVRGERALALADGAQALASRARVVPITDDDADSYGVAHRASRNFAVATAFTSPSWRRSAPSTCSRPCDRSSHARMRASLANRAPGDLNRTVNSPVCATQPDLKQAMGHRAIQQHADHAAVHQSARSPRRSRRNRTQGLHAAAVRATGVNVRPSPCGLSVAAHDAVRVECGGDRPRIERVPVERSPFIASPPGSMHKAAAAASCHHPPAVRGWRSAPDRDPR